MSARILEGPIIETREGRGRGALGDPFRIVTHYYAADGTKLAENDPCAPEYRPVLVGDKAGMTLPANAWFYDADQYTVAEKRRGDVDEL